MSRPITEWVVRAAVGGPIRVSLDGQTADITAEMAGEMIHDLSVAVSIVLQQHNDMKEVAKRVYRR